MNEIRENQIENAEEKKWTCISYFFNHVYVQFYGHWHDNLDYLLK